MLVPIDTEAIRARKGRGLWGDTITRLCDEVDHLNTLIERHAEANMEKDEQLSVAYGVGEWCAAERDALAEQVAELTETVAVGSDDDVMQAIARSGG